MSDEEKAGAAGTPTARDDASPHLKKLQQKHVFDSCPACHARDAWAFEMKEVLGRRALVLICMNCGFISAHDVDYISGPDKTNG